MVGLFRDFNGVFGVEERKSMFALHLDEGRIVDLREGWKERFLRFFVEADEEE